MCIRDSLCFREYIFPVLQTRMCVMFYTCHISDTGDSYRKREKILEMADRRYCTRINHGNSFWSSGSIFHSSVYLRRRVAAFRHFRTTRWQIQQYPLYQNCHDGNSLRNRNFNFRNDLQSLYCPCLYSLSEWLYSLFWLSKYLRSFLSEDSFPGTLFHGGKYRFYV